MTWEVASAWAGVVVSIVFGYLANHRSKASKKEAEEATERSREALAANQSMATSLDKIAESFNRLRPVSGPQDAQSSPGDPSEQGGHPGQPDIGGREDEQTSRSADRLPPAWNVEYRSGSSYALRNVGAGSATHVTIDAQGSLAKNLPTDDGVSLSPGQAHAFMLIQAPLPTGLLVSSSELGPVHVAVPPK
ncbi:MAG: hypothetical protein JWM76_2796 [Pseudonocardiales bacterium]|nr:hypothetical protein [Pseudonocardiales bacterium]